MAASIQKQPSKSAISLLFLPSYSTGNDPRKGWRIPLNEIKYNEQRDEETGIVYCDTYQPHAPRRIKDTENQRLYDLQWDRAGNLGQCNTAKDDGSWLGSRHLFWTADCCGPRPCGANRMHAAVDADNYSYYTYDYTGERTLKLTGRNSEMDVNAELQHTSAALDRPTLYPSPYLVMGMHGYTKHYYAGTERICAKTGGGFGGSITGSLPDLQAAADSLFSQSRENIRCRELLQNDMECVASYGHVPDAEMNVHLYEMPSHFRADAEIHLGEFHRVVEWCEHGSEEEDKVFFYHSDHLGSASWITDAQGDAIQHLQYLPYGEPFVDQRISGYSERFRFTGKERDEETGFGYFGARYMDHELMTMWLSVDPMADKYPSISPYAYCAWNPVKLVDPDGLDTVDVTYDGKKWNLSNHIIAKGNDVIRVNDGNNQESYVFSEGQYGNRKCNLRISRNGEEVLGVYLLSGQKKNGVGFQVERYKNVLDKERKMYKCTLIPEGDYSIAGSDYGTDISHARYPGFITTNVTGYSGVRSHYQMKDIASYRYSEACQIIGIDSYELLAGYVMLGAANTINASCEVARYFGAESPNATRRMTNMPKYPFQVYWSYTSRVSNGRNIFKNRPCLNL